jgi:hypothetical protein
MVRPPNYSQERAARARKKQARREQKAEEKAAKTARPEKASTDPTSVVGRNGDEPKT